MSSSSNTASGTVPSATPSIRNRATHSTEGDGSPTSTTMSDSVSFYPAEESLTPGFLRSQSSTFLGARRTVIRTDTTLLTSFDPADKQLYDLWAPKS
ncbi:hypothetical protein BKA82DRAFT_4107173 [Pisolithus tinctorius]|nr:hypothetical protein BKA82DRAFT_4107173 [Pisolithus tinctorius]